MAVDVNEIVRWTANFVLDDGSQYQNVYHHRKIGSAQATDLEVITAIQDQADDLYAELAGDASDTIVSALSTIDVVEFDVDQWLVIRHVGTYTPAFTGALSNVALPNQTSCFVTFKTARPSSVGRKFLFPFTIADVVAGILTAGLVTSETAYAAIALTNMVIDILNELEPGIVRTTVDEFLPFTAAVVTNISGSQRRRRPGTGA